MVMVMGRREKEDVSRTYSKAFTMVGLEQFKARWSTSERSSLEEVLNCSNVCGRVIIAEK